MIFINIKNYHKSYFYKKNILKFKIYFQINNLYISLNNYINKLSHKSYLFINMITSVIFIKNYS